MESNPTANTSSNHSKHIEEHNKKDTTTKKRALTKEQVQQNCQALFNRLHAIEADIKDHKQTLEQYKARKQGNMSEGDRLLLKQGEDQVKVMEDWSEELRAKFERLAAFLAK